MLIFTFIIYSMSQLYDFSKNSICQICTNFTHLLTLAMNSRNKLKLNNILKGIHSRNVNTLNEIQLLKNRNKLLYNRMEELSSQQMKNIKGGNPTS